MARENGSGDDHGSDEENNRGRKRDRRETVRDLNPEWADPKHLDLICIRRRCLPAPFVPVKISRREERTRRFRKLRARTVSRKRYTAPLAREISQRAASFRDEFEIFLHTFLSVPSNSSTSRCPRALTFGITNDSWITWHAHGTLFAK